MAYSVEDKVEELLEQGKCPDDYGYPCDGDCMSCDIGSKQVLESIDEY